jgi:hypothetical protein
MMVYPHTAQVNIWKARKGSTRVDVVVTIVAVRQTETQVKG